MTIVAVGQKDFRQNISRFAKSSKENNTSYIVTHRNKPLWEVKPCFNNDLSLDSTQIDYYSHIEKNLDFWNSDDDNDIFSLAV
jgi:hypothetical protein